MMPLLVRLKIEQKGKSKFNLWIPVFLFWILLLWLSIVFWNVLIILILLLLAISLLGGKVVHTINIVFGFVEMLSPLSGMTVDMENSDSRVNLRII